MGPYIPVGVIMDESKSGCWINHQSIVQYNGQWYLFYHDRDYSPKFDKNLSVRVDSLSFNSDGTIKKVIATFHPCYPVCLSQRGSLFHHSITYCFEWLSGFPFRKFFYNAKIIPNFKVYFNILDHAIKIPLFRLIVIRGLMIICHKPFL